MLVAAIQQDSSQTRAERALNAKRNYENPVQVQVFARLKPGTRIVTNGFEIAGWKAEETGRADGDDLWSRSHREEHLGRRQGRQAR